MAIEDTLAQLRALANRKPGEALAPEAANAMAEEATDLGRRMFAMLNIELGARDMLAAQSMVAAGELLHCVIVHLAHRTGACNNAVQSAELAGLAMQIVVGAIFDPRWSE
jgi:hypothetical protein